MFRVTQARADAEARFQHEAALREAEQQRLREVEELRQQLQLLLEAERQAKKDEEIVRSLQSRSGASASNVGPQRALCLLGAGRKTILLIFNPLISLYIYYDQYEKKGEKCKIIVFPCLFSMEMAAIFDFRALTKVHITLKLLLQMQW